MRRIDKVLLFFEKTFTKGIYDIHRKIWIENYGRCDFDEKYTENEYDQFVEYMKNRISSLPKDDMQFISELCKKISSRKLRMCDEEDYCEFTPVTFYLDCHDKIILVDPSGY